MKRLQKCLAAAMLLAAAAAALCALPVQAREEGARDAAPDALHTVCLAEYDGTAAACDTLLLHLDEELNVTDAEGKVLAPLAEFETDAVPAYYIKDSEAADAFAQYAQQNGFLDGIVVSDTPALVARVRQANTAGSRLSGMIDFRGKQPTVAQVQQSVNANMAKTALFDLSALTADYVRTLQKLLINVWADAASKEETYRALSYGCTGLLSRELPLSEAVKEADFSVLSPRPVLVAHRGCSEGAGKENLENTVAAARLAFERGAEAVEIDVHLTADGQLIVMHNDTLEGTTDGRGYIEQLALQDIRRYKVNGNINFFNDDRRISVLGMSNNVNQQNFSQEDLAGVMSSGTSGRGGRGGRGGGGGRQGGGPGGGSASNFMVGSLGGVTSANSLGLNYVDQWGKKWKVTGSYFFNQSDNLTQQLTDREYFESVLPGMTYSEYQESQMENWNHRFNLKLDYQISDRTSLQIRPSLSFQNNDSYSLLQGKNLLDGTAESETETKSNGNTDAYNIGIDLNLRHRFLKEGRTLSLMVSGKTSNTDGDTYTDYLNTLYGADGLAVTDEYSQWKQTLNQQYSLRSNLSYTEKLTDKLQLQLGYKLSYTDSENDRKTYDRSPVTDLYDQLDESLSNEYQSGYLTQAGNVGLRYRAGKFNAMLGVDAQWADLTGDLVYPQPDELSRKYFSILPSFTLRYSLDRTNSLQLRYRSKSSAPSVTNLQNVIDNSNPLFLSTGNPNLDQQVSHTANLRYIRTTKSGHTFIAMIGGTIQ